jgi:Na+-driven multidrug efflux pump
MCGFEKLQSNILMICLLLNIILDYLFIPKFGGIGAAMGSSASLIILNIVKVAYTKRKVGVSTLPSIRKKNK